MFKNLIALFMLAFASFQVQADPVVEKAALPNFPLVTIGSMTVQLVSDMDWYGLVPPFQNDEYDTGVGLAVHASPTSQCGPGSFVRAVYFYEGGFSHYTRDIGFAESIGIIPGAELQIIVRCQEDLWHHQRAQFNIDARNGKLRIEVDVIENAFETPAGTRGHRGFVKCLTDNGPWEYGSCEYVKRQPSIK
jgi:hypothetical protein